MVFELRQSQLIGTYGPGALVTDKTGVSWLIQGLRHWYCSNSDAVECVAEAETRTWVLHEPRLEQLLGVSELRRPPEFRKMTLDSTREIASGRGQQLPANVFPRIWTCRTVNCGITQRVTQAPTGGAKAGRCPDHGDTMKQIRFAVVCEDGHLDDFPASEWVHREPSPSCPKEAIRIRADGNRTGLSGLAVHCAHCNKTRTLERIGLGKGNTSFLQTSCYQDGVSKYSCSGQRPWLGLIGSGSAVCEKPPIGTYLGASNLYFSDVQSALSLPSDSPAQRLEAYLNNLPQTEQMMIKFMPGSPALRNIAQQNPRFAFIDEFTDQQLDAAIAALQSDVPVSSGTLLLGDIREKEFQVLNSETIPAALFPEQIPLAAVQGFSGMFERIATLGKVTETRVLAGFTRRRPPQEISLEGTSARRNMSTRAEKWLPAVQVTGEGIFFALSNQALDLWGEEKTVIHRVQSIKSALQSPEWSNSRYEKYGEFLSRYLCAHTISHSVIRAISIRLGINSASLRERVYADSSGAGFLVFSSDGDELGSLGGLLQAIDPGSIAAILLAAIASTQWCALDPTCEESGHDSQAASDLNIAACHDCLYLPETSCEAGNRLLDRGVVSNLEGLLPAFSVYGGMHE